MIFYLFILTSRLTALYSGENWAKDVYACGPESFRSSTGERSLFSLTVRLCISKTLNNDAWGKKVPPRLLANYVRLR